MRNGMIAASTLLFLLTQGALATNWKSPDGRLGFNIPDDGPFVEVKNPPSPAAAMWTCPDDGARLVFLAQPIPGDLSLEGEGLKEGTLKAFPGGTLLTSVETKLGQIPVFTLALNSNRGLYVQQTVTAFNGMSYKVMAASPKLVSTDPRFVGVFQSITILDPNAVAPGKKISPQELLAKIGAWGIILLVIAGIISLSRRLSRRQPTPPPLPPRQA